MNFLLEILAVERQERQGPVGEESKDVTHVSRLLPARRRLPFPRQHLTGCESQGCIASREAERDGGDSPAGDAPRPCTTAEVPWNWRRRLPFPGFVEGNADLRASPRRSILKSNVKETFLQLYSSYKVETSRSKRTTIGSHHARAGINSLLTRRRRKKTQKEIS